MIDFDIKKGNNDFVFFLHGWGGDKNSFALVKNYPLKQSLVFVSFSGFGESPEPSLAYNLFDYVEELRLAIITLAKGKKVTLVCHSFGTRVAVYLTAIYPSLVSKIMIIDGAGIKPKRKLDYYLKVHKYKRLKKQVLSGKKDKKELKNYGSSDYKKLSSVMKQTFINVVNQDLKNCFKTITCPVFILWGENDQETPLYMAKKINKYIQNSELFIIKNAGHFSYLDRPDIFLSALDKFLNDE